MLFKAAKIAHEIRKDSQIGDQLERLAAEGNQQASEAYNQGQRHKTCRTAIVGVTAVSLAAGGFLGFNNIVDGLKSVVPHDDIQTRVQGQLRKVTIPNDAILVEGTGSSVARMNVRPESDLPVIGGIFNHTVARLADMNAYAEREGKVQIMSKRNAIKLSAVQVPAPNTGKKQWQLKANVASDKLSTQLADMHYRTKDGEPLVSASNDLLSLATAKGITDRTAGVTELADTIFQNTCGRALQSNIPAGVQKFAQDTVRAAAEVMDSTGQQSDTDLLHLLAKRPVVVRFDAPARLADGSVSRREIAADQIELPTTKQLTNESMARTLGKPAEDVHIDTGAGDCVYTAEAVNDQQRISGSTGSGQDY